MDDNKVLGIDGFNDCFFKKLCEVLKEDVCVVVKECFRNGKILKVINCVIIIFIFKVKSFEYVKEFRLIVCCIILYKIVFKVFVNKLMLVLNFIIGDS